MARDSRPFSRTVSYQRTRPPTRAIPLLQRWGRKATWEVRPLQQCDYDEGLRILKAYGRRRDQPLRIQGNFMTLCRLSGTSHTDPMSAVGALGQMSNSGLGPGSCSTYMSYIRKKFPTSYEAAYAANVYAADHEAKHANDIPDEVLWKFVELSPPEWQPIIYLMYVCGFRVVAIKFFRRRRIFLPLYTKWGHRDLEIVVAVDKTRKKKGQRATLVLPRAWKYPRPPSYQTWQYLMEGDMDGTLFSNVSASKVNAVLRKLAKDHALKRPTTYSFRRAYINRVIPLAETKGCLKKYTLHYDETTVDAFYRRTARERDALQQGQC